MSTPPIYGELGPAPAGVCSRWLGEYPCGAAATHHVIWADGGANGVANGAVCAGHQAEVRARWAYAGLHPYGPACAASGTQASRWLPDEDRCELVSA